MRALLLLALVAGLFAADEATAKIMGTKDARVVAVRVMVSNHLERPRTVFFDIEGVNESGEVVIVSPDHFVDVPAGAPREKTVPVVLENGEKVSAWRVVRLKSHRDFRADPLVDPLGNVRP